MQPQPSAQVSAAPVKWPFPVIKIIIALVGIALLGVMGFVAVKYFNSQPSVDSNIPPVVVTPAPADFTTSLILTASESSYIVGDKVTVSLIAKSDNDAANLFVAKMRFPKDLLQVVDINFESDFISNWFVTNWVENTFDNNMGTISLVGGVPNPGYKTNPDSDGGLMAGIILEAKKGGSATIVLDPTSSVYRNSDNANILKTKKDLTLQITEATPAATSTPTSTPSEPTATPTATPSASLEGDINDDTKVDLADLSALLTFWNKTRSDVGKADLNKDEVVNTFDFSALSKILDKLGVISTN